jgi:hypothetical protein
MAPQWNTISLGEGIYHIKCVKRGFYVGWEEEDFHDGAKCSDVQDPILLDNH